jgi:UDP-glucose 4-epimerase
MKHKILVTGAAGFVGQRIVKRLVEQEQEVIALDIKHHDFNNTLVQFVQKDVRDFLGECLTQTHTVIHLANLARIDPSWEKPNEYIDVNVNGTLSLFRRSQLARVENFLYVSSSSVYGDNGNNVQKETDHQSPTNPYAISKQAAEQLLLAYADQASTKLLIARPYTMYGKTMAQQHNALVIGKFIWAYRNNLPLVVHGSGDQRRDFILVDEAIEAMLLLLNRGHHKDIFNIGTGSNVSVLDLAHVLGVPIKHTEARPGPDYDTCADISKLKTLGFKPNVKVLDWLREHKEQSFKEFK